MRIETKYIKDIDGKDVNLPNVPWGREKQALSIIAEIFDIVPSLEIEKYDLNKLKPLDVCNMLPPLLRGMPDHVTRLTAVILGKDSEWVDNTLDLESILEVITPFFSHFYAMYEKHEKKKQKENKKK